MDVVRSTLVTDIRSYEQQLAVLNPEHSRYKNIKGVIATLKTALAKNHHTYPSDPSDTLNSLKPLEPLEPPNPQQKNSAKTKVTQNTSNHGAEKSMQELVNNVKETERRFQNLHKRITASVKTKLADETMKEEYEDIVDECLLACVALEARGKRI